MKQIQPFQKHWLQLTSIVDCRLKVKQVLRTLSMAFVTSEHQKGQGSMPQISRHTWEISHIKDNDMDCVGS